MNEQERPQQQGPPSGHEKAICAISPAAREGTLVPRKPPFGAVRFVPFLPHAAGAHGPTDHLLATMTRGLIEELARRTGIGAADHRARREAYLAHEPELHAAFVAFARRYVERLRAVEQREGVPSFALGTWEDEDDEELPGTHERDRVERARQLVEQLRLQFDAARRADDAIDLRLREVARELDAGGGS